MRVIHGTWREEKAMGTIYKGAIELVGKTPLVELVNLEKREGLKARLLAKVEYFNPAGSVKDRVGKAMIEAAEQSGELKPGAVIIQPTSGNTGIGLASVAAAKGYRMILTMPDTMSVERRNILKAYGAEIVLTPGERGMTGAIEKAEELAKEIPGSFIPGQFDNPENPKAHETATGPEIWEDTDGCVDAFVAGVGTGGTISGTGHYLKDVSNGAVQVIGADPEGSIYSNPDDVHQYQIEGVGEDFYPKAFDRSLPDEIVQVTDAEAFEMTRRLANEEGLLVGGSSGMAVFSALKYAREHDLDENQLVVVLMPDSGRSYMEKIFNDDWMRANGFADVVERTTKPSLAEQYL